MGLGFEHAPKPSIVSFLPVRQDWYDMLDRAVRSSLNIVVG